MDAVAAACAPRPSWKHRCPANDRRSRAVPGSVPPHPRGADLPRPRCPGRWECAGMDAHPAIEQTWRVLYSYDQPGAMCRGDGSRASGAGEQRQTTKVEPFSEDSDEVGVASVSVGSAETLAEDEAIDFITGDNVKLKGNEEVRQQVARALYAEYGIRVQDMERDFPITLRWTGEKAEEGGHRHLRARDRAYDGEPTPGGDLQAGAEGRAERHQAPHLHAGGEGPRRAGDPARHGGDPPGPVRHVDQRVDYFFLHKTQPVERKFEPQASWPLADETVRPDTVASVGGCAAARPGCSRRRSAAATTTSTAMRACRRTRLSGSSSICCSPRCTTNGRAAHRAAARVLRAPHQSHSMTQDAGRSGGGSRRYSMR